MNLLSVSEITKLKIIKVNNKIVRDSRTVKKVLEALDIKSIKMGRQNYYKKAELYEALGLELEETEEE